MIHLQIDDDNGSKDTYLRSAQIIGIETEPPLDDDFLESLGKNQIKLTTVAVRLLKRAVKRIVFPKRGS